MSDPKDEERRARRHDLRTPLNQILGYSEMLHEDATERGEEAMARDLEKIQAAARRMMELVEVLVPGPAEAAGGGGAAKGPQVLLAPSEASAPSGDEALGHVLVVDDNEMNRDMLSRRSEHSRVHRHGCRGRRGGPRHARDPSASTRSFST